MADLPSFSMTQLLLTLLAGSISTSLLAASFVDHGKNLDDLPQVPEGFKVTLVAREPLVRNPCSLAFDAEGRMFVGMGPQYRNPTPDTPRDSVVQLIDDNGDGVADRTQVFATGFNCIQGLAWHGRDLWVANSPDLTVVHDLDGDGVADEYVKVFTDLGNIEHAVHGLVWAPDGRLYLSKGNSKGVSLEAEPKEPGRIAPKAFRELWHVTGPAADAPSPVTFKPAEYKNTYQDPRDDWGAMGGVLRCEDMGRNLEIVARGMRNPWDIGFDGGFNCLGTDNDQNEGDRILMPFAGANYGWGHAWSAGWTGENQPHVAPMSGKVFQGSGTGIIFADSPAFPKAWRGVWLINDWLRKTTFVYRPQWQGALITPEGGDWQPFITGKDALYRPTDMEMGPDGALYVLGWGREYGGTFDKDGAQTNEGRVFRLMPSDAKPVVWNTAKRSLPLKQWTAEQLMEDLDSHLPIARINAADELTRRGEAVKPALLDCLKHNDIGDMKRTWAMWTLGRIAKDDAAFTDWLTTELKPGHTLNGRIQSLRLLGSRHATGVAESLNDPEPRIRFEALQSLRAAHDTGVAELIIKRAGTETEQMNHYALWLAFRDLLGKDRLKNLLGDEQAGVRRAAMLALLDLEALPKEDVRRFVDDKDESIRTLVQLALGHKPAKDKQVANLFYEAARNIVAGSKRSYQLGALRVGDPCYTDRPFTIKSVPGLITGCATIQTANADDHSSGRSFLSFDIPIEMTLYVAQDERVKQRPDWLKDFADTDMTIATSDSKLHLWSKDFPAGHVTLGGNIQDGTKGKGFSQYFVVLQPKPLAPSGKLTSIDEALALEGSKDRGEGLFFAQAGCANCHRIGQRGTNFGPDLTNLRDRVEPRFIAQSILEPNAVITEGFAAHTVEADGKSYFGILLEEDNKALSLGLIDGTRAKLKKKSISKHETLAASPMPPFSALLNPQQVADLMVFLSQKLPVATAPQTSAKK